MEKLINNQVQYIEFITENIERSKSFYRNSFDWHFTDYGPDYTAFEGKYVDGGFTTGTPKNGSILIVMYSENLEACKEKIIQNEGEIVKDIFSFPGGRRFQFKDLDGYELAVWSL